MNEFVGDAIIDVILTPHALSDSGSKASDFDFDLGSGSELGSDESEETSSEEGGEVARAQDEMKVILIAAFIIPASGVLDFSVLFLEIADAYLEKEMYGNAKTRSFYVLMQRAACLKNIGELRDMADVYEHDGRVYSVLRTGPGGSIDCRSTI
ncbi:hypothetical protein BJ165DRAFT_1407030 [Panaeolus papilionaceus]|nr:hypothetical protein BJ165DRAFT_1407030 [Panaeolus papilionaceus]